MKDENIKNEINEIILSNQIEAKQNIIFEYIPELKNMVGFEHKHPHHFLDVWNHTLLVLDNLKDENDLELKMAGLLHDIGKPFSYQEGEVRHFHGHPIVSNDMCTIILNRLGYDKKFIQDVSYLVLNHDTPINLEDINNSYEMIQKLLKLQYADAKAHHKDKIQKRIDYLDSVSMQLKLKK